MWKEKEYKNMSEKYMEGNIEEKDKHQDRDVNKVPNHTPRTITCMGRLSGVTLPYMPTTGTNRGVEAKVIHCV